VGGLTAALLASNPVRLHSSSYSPASPAAAQQPGAQPGVTSYLCPFNDEWLLLQWDSNQGSDLNGTYQDAKITGQVPQEQVTSSNGDFSGTENGSAITVVFDTVTWYGKTSGSSITLNVPQPGGTIQPVTCNSSGLARWNTSVSTLDNQAASDNNTYLQRQASASSAAAQASQESTAQADVTTLQQDSLSGDVSQIGGDVTQTDNDLARTRSDAANGNGYDCENVQDTVYNDAATTVYNDVLTTVLNEADNLGTDIAKVRKDITTVQNDQAALSTARLPGTSGAGAAISAAQNMIATAIATANADIDHANSDLSAAYAVADSVGAGSCAGDGPGNPPSGVSHLS
jgi:hypothetical protein